MLYPRIEKKINKIINELNINKPPIKVNEICTFYELNFEYSDLGKNVSGLLAKNSSRSAIGVNVHENETRQRFTIAHELGHYLLHTKKQDQLFIEDKKMYRDKSSSSGELKMEREANAFAAALLMPEHLLKSEIDEAGLDPSNEDSIKQLAADFKVSEVAMTYRLTNLKLM